MDALKQEIYLLVRFGRLSHYSLSIAFSRLNVAKTKICRIPNFPYWLIIFKNKFLVMKMSCSNKIKH
jgi:hypothetical protein